MGANKLVGWGWGCVAVVALTGCHRPAAPRPDPEPEGKAVDSVQVVKDYFSATKADGRAAAIDRYMAPDVQYTVITALGGEVNDVLPWIGRKVGRQAVKDYLDWLYRNQGLKELTFDQFVSDGETVVAFGTITTRSLATGNEGRWEYAMRLRVRGGLIHEYFLFENSYAAAALHRRRGSWAVENDGRPRDVP